MRIYCKFSFLLPLSLFVFLSCIVYIVCLIREAIRLQNANYESSLIRNKEEIRMAKVRTLISHWQSEHQKLPFNYKSEQSSDSSNSNYAQLPNPPGITVAILAPNRAAFRTDAYETFYLTDSVVSFMNASYHDLALYGSRFRFINLTVCLAEDEPSKIKELKTVKQLLGTRQIKYRPDSWVSKSLQCRTILDAGNCLLQSVGPRNNTYTILVEDDLIPDPLFFKHLWDTLIRLKSQEHTKQHPPGLIQLYTPNSLVYFSPLDFTSMVELVILSSFLTFLLISFYLRLWWKPFLCFYNVVLVGSAFCTCTLVLCLVGRLNLLSVIHRTLNLFTLRLSSSPNSVSNGAAALVSSELAYKLGNLLLSVDCDSGAHIKSPMPSKADLIYDYLTSQHLSVWSIFPSLVKHSGLYSLYDGGVPNPFRVD